MQSNELENGYVEKTMKSGEVMSLATGPNNGFDVDQWDNTGANRWHRWYATYEEAIKEYDRWN